MKFGLRPAAVTLGTAGMLAGGALVGPASAAPTTQSAPTVATVAASAPTQQRGWYNRGYWYGYRDARDCRHDYPSEDYPREWWRGYRNGWQRGYYQYCRDRDHGGDRNGRDHGGDRNGGGY